MAEKYTCKFRIGGHSKGGNLAVYSAVFCEDEIKDRITYILNADGPGVNKETITSDEYKKIVDKIHTYVPQSSIIGRLLEHEENYIIVESKQKGIMQHDIYSWQVQAKNLNKISNLTNRSETTNRMVKEWLNSTTQEQREAFINTLYQIVEKTEAKTITDFSNQWFKNLRKIIETYKSVDVENKKQVEEMIKLTLNAIIVCIKNEILNKNKG